MKTYKTSLSVLLGAAMCALLIGGCGTVNPEYLSPQLSGREGGMPMIEQSSTDAAVDSAGAFEEMASADMGTAGAGVALDGKIAVSGDAQVVTDDPASAAKEFKETVIEAGGQVESTWESDYDGARSAWVSVRVPAQTYTEIVAGLNDLGHVESQSSNSADLQQQYIDVEARRTSLEQSIARVEDLADSATSTQELLLAEDMLTQQRGELDSLNQQMEWLDQQVEMSFLTVSFNTQAADPGPSISFGWIGNVLLQSIYTIALVVVFALPWLIIAIPLALLWRKRARNRRESTVEVSVSE